MINSQLHITSLNIPALEPFRTLRRPIDHLRQGIFVAESEKVSLRLLESPIEPISILLSSDWFERYRTVIEHHSLPINVYIGEKSLIETIVGHRLHQSIMVLARVPKQITMEELLAHKNRHCLYVMVDGITNAENMGVIVRNCASFQVDALIVLPTSCDPYLRRSVRNSMGNIFKLPIVYVNDTMRDIQRMKEEGIALYAAFLSTKSKDIRNFTFKNASCIILGAEGNGITPDIVSLSDEWIQIPMKKGVDSLNVASASAVLLYEASQQLHRK